MESLGNRVKQARTLMGVSREKLAELLEISPQHLTKIEQGERKISIELLAKMSKIFCLSADYLLFGRDAPASQSLTLTDMLDGLTAEERTLAEDMLKLTIRALRAGK